MRRLSEAADIVVGVATRAPRRRGSGPTEQMLTVRALSERGIDPGALSELELTGRLSEQQRVRAGDVLLSARSTRLAVAVVTPELEDVPFNATLIAIRCLPVLEPRLLAAYVRHPEGVAAVMALAQSGTVQMNVTAKALRTLLVPVPPMAEQEGLVALLAAADDAYTAAVGAASVRRDIAQSIVMNRLTTA